MNEKPTKFYKLLNNNEESLWYWGRIAYSRLGVTQAPKGTKLFVFGSLEEARMFQEKRENVTLWEAKVTNPVKARYSASSRLNIPAFWKMYRSKKKWTGRYGIRAGLRCYEERVCYEECVKGTYFVDSVELIQKVV